MFFAPVAFEQRAEHLLRRLTGGNIGDELGISLFDELYPRGTAGREHGHRLIRLYTVDKLACLFHYRKVCGNVHIEYRIRAEASYRRYHFSFHVGADRHIERFSESRTNRRSGEEHYLFSTVSERVPYLVNRRVFAERAYGARNYTLTAAYAGGLGKRTVERASYMYVEASADRADSVYVLFAASRHAAHAVDAFIVVAYYVRGGQVDRENEVLALESVFVHAVTERQFLQFAVVVSFAGKTLFLVLAQEEFQSHFTRAAALVGICSYLHAFRDGVYARRDQTARARCFYHAHTAGASAAYVFEEAEGRYLDMRLSRRLQYCRTFGYGDGYSVYFKIDHFFHFLHLTFSLSRRICSWRYTVRILRTLTYR